MVISYEDLRMYAYSNDRLINGPVRGAVVEFTGLNGTAMRDSDSDFAVQLAQQNIAYLFPYINPWAWMNKAAVKLTDAVIRTLYSRYRLDDTLPLVSVGGSMGGQCALVYCRYAALTPSACAANCPVCDLPFHYTERRDLPRTFLSAFGEYDMPLEDALRSASPLHLADEMPSIPYFIVHCEEDKAVSKAAHSDRLVKALSKRHQVTYLTVPGRGHCDLTPEARENYNEFILSAFGG
ncbi:MAG: prolyl oligopeptidase family serine peptidase [Clostridiales bacterium]|nr:prolyl oligopeptidase family serine peptidase [Clostridiales bacterium]